ncbi:hypothetical protein B6A42_09060 [Vibrio coralliilyticus]|nr:hypothetical protein B6A42_09060 [Vibrio coralliilyticus]
MEKRIRCRMANYPGMYSSREKDVNNNGDAVAWVCEEECYTVLWHKSGEIESLKSEIDEPLNDFIKDLGFNAFNDRIHINDSGQLAGTVVYKPYDQYEGSRATIAWTWDKKSKLKILVEPNIRPRGQAYGISNSGVVYGSYHHDDHVNEAATYWDKHGEMQQFKFPQFPYGTVATGMNNSGVLVGVESLMYSSPWKIDTKSGKRLHIEDTGGVARPTKVLDNGYIAGSTQSDLNSQLSPILWDSKGNVYYLNDYLDDESYSLGGWIGINNSLLMGSALVNKNTDWYEDGALYQITVVSPE